MSSNIKRRKNVEKEVETKPAEIQTKSEEIDEKVKKQEKFGTIPKVPNQKLFIRVVVVISVFIIMYYTSNKEKEKKFAQFKENLPLRSMKVDCAESYRQELSLFPHCVPQSCGRFVTDSLVTEKEAKALFELAEAGFKFGLSSGSASILDLHSGALSKGDHFINIYKLENAKDILKKEGFQIYKVVKSKILQSISQKFSINENHLYLTHPTFFSRLSNATAVSMNDEYWHPHVDKETYESFHYTSLVYLTNFGLDFTGGRFIFIESDNRTKTTIEPKAGRVMAFTSGAENLHYVEKVESGIRYALTVSFTCDEKFAINDPELEI